MFRRKKDEKDQEERVPVAAPPPPAPSIPVFRAPPPTPQLRTATVARPATEPQPEAPRAPAAASAVGKQLTVGQGIFLSGEITACDRVLVEGTVEATLTESRNLEVLAAGVFSGHADIETADIAGRFDGEITVSGKLVIRASGRVVGKVRYGQISIEAGGEIAGEVQVLPPAQAVRPTGGDADELLDRDYLAEQKAG